MSSISDKIEYLKETKRLFKQWIIDNDGTVTDTTPFRDYVDIIDAILTRGPIEPPKPKEWMNLQYVSTTNPGKVSIKWAPYDDGSGNLTEQESLYVYSMTDFSSALFNPFDSNTYTVICSLLTEEMGGFQLIMYSNDLSIINLGWLNTDANGNYQGMVPMPDVCLYSVENYGGGGYGVKIESEYLFVNTPAKVISAGLDGMVVITDIMIEKY